VPLSWNTKLLLDSSSRSQVGERAPAIRAARLFSALTLIAAAFAFAQSAQYNSVSAQNSQAASVLRVSARLVQVNVIAQDRDGKPITNLTKDDFTVSDEGAAQKILFFSPLSAPAPISTADGAAPNSPSAPVRVFSNRLAAEPGVSTSVTVILLDAVNTDFADMSYARAQVIKFARRASRDDQISLYLLTNTKLYILHDFTSDAETLVRVLGGAKKDADTSDPNVVAATAANKRMNKALGDAFAESNRFYKGPAINRAAVTSEAMQDIAKRVAGIPGRKNLVWVSGGFPIDIGYGRRIGATGGGSRVSFIESLSNTAKALNNANVSVYPVDARGLLGDPSTLAMLKGVSRLGGDARGGVGGATASGAAPDDRPFTTMNTIAAGTGGRAFYNGNDIAASIRHAIDDSRESYAIGYYPDHNQWDGKYRQIVVKVNRPGVTLRYRGGYFATSEGSNNAAQRKQLLADAVRSPVQLINLGLEVHVEPVAAGGTRQLAVQIRVNPDQLHFDQSGDRWTNSLDIAWVELSADGRIVAHGGHTLTVKPAQSGYDEILKSGLSFSEHVTLNVEGVEVRLVVRDAGSGETGSVNIPLAKVLTPNNAATPAKK
jgi:VWFA-related protein